MIVIRAWENAGKRTGLAAVLEFMFVLPRTEAQ
jgi:hypothetical protein